MKMAVPGDAGYEVERFAEKKCETCGRQIHKCHDWAGCYYDGLKDWIPKAVQPKSSPVLGETCPFCKESGFDLIGLKSHIQNGDCEIYNNTENLGRVFNER